MKNTPGKYNVIHFAYLGLGENDKAVAARDAMIAYNNEINRERDYYDDACFYSGLMNKEKANLLLGQSLLGGLGKIEIDKTFKKRPHRTC